MPELAPLSEEQERADVYALLAALLLDPDAEMIAALAGLPRRAAGEDELAPAWNDLLEAATRCGPSVLADHESLFVAAGTPRLNPYECFYRDGWLMDKPLALLRDDLRRLGLARAERATELEDHLGALCEAMRLLIQAGQPQDVQREFFLRHLAGWSPRCLQDMAAAGSGGFYATLASFMQAFFRGEAERFALDEVPASFHPPRTSRHAADPS